MSDESKNNLPATGVEEGAPSTPATLPITSDEYRRCSDILEEARSYLLDHNLYLSHAVCLMGNPILTREIPTAAVSADEFGGIVFGFNPDFLVRLHQEEGPAGVALILTHETFHLYGCHTGSIMENKNKALWNICADVIVNTWLFESGMFPVSDKLKENLWDAKKVGLPPGVVLRHLDVESIYEELITDVKKQADILQKVMGMGFGNEDGTFDSHEALKTIRDPVLEELAKNLEKSGYSPKQGGKSWGNTPDGAVRVFDKIKEVFDWQRHLMRFIGSVVKRETTWERRNKRLQCTFPQFMIPFERIRIDHRIIVYGDMSGSIDAGTVARFVSIIGQAPNNIKMDCFTFDTRIYEWDIKGKPQGGGGTDFQAVVNHAQGQGRSDAYIVLTDGLCSEPTVQRPRKWLWLTTHSTLSNRCGRWMSIGQTR